MKEKIVNSKQIEIFTQSFGDKENPAVVLIAGATVSMLFWDSVFCQRLSENGFFVIRYDHRDVGQSTFYKPGTTPYDIVNLTDDVISILKDYKIDKAHLVGMSLGGLIAQIAAIKYSNQINSLTLISTGPWGDSDTSIPEMDTRILEFHSKAGVVDWTNEDSVVHYLLQGAELISGKKKFYKDRSEKLIREEFRRAKNYISMFNHASLDGGQEFWNRLDEIKNPTLIIHGTEDKIWHYNHTNVLLDKIKNSKLISLKGTGHEIHFDDWNIIIEGITKHCKMR